MRGGGACGLNWISTAECLTKNNIITLKAAFNGLQVCFGIRIVLPHFSQLK